ncbi:hypothetical protein AWJ20_315 [Sugiyamaella lignohabitans]|uniref:N-acetylgalactosaminide beta-1,3-galactosyltransferase n=1 Tax=Sugiyamaella lignohabitans TaxID=796027 RepID=A0A167CT89_9ASCO|nr:uncharacterized protein AWJ20_315 [Sugiyamaella lignohabitans]ANB12080.1 hypothetical protein AWJ20_315 [Sugiyamaella lignohabitans]
MPRVTLNRPQGIVLTACILLFVGYELFIIYNRNEVDPAWSKISSPFSKTPKTPQYVTEFKEQMDKGGYIPSLDSYDLYESVDVWRSPESFSHAYDDNPNSRHKSSMHFDNVHGRPKNPDPASYGSTGEYLKIPLVADYPPNADKIFLMIKTGASVLWDRLPVHLFTTLTRVPNFAIYSDAPGSVGGYEVIDVLANMTAKSRLRNEFKMYRDQRTLHDTHGNMPLTDVMGKDGWVLDKFKNIPMLAHAWTVSPDSDWYVFMDADSFYFIDNLVEVLSHFDPNQPLYMGSPAGAGRYTFAHGGSGVVLSHRTMQDTVGVDPIQVPKDYEDRTFKECCGDLMVAYMVVDRANTLITPNPSFKGEPYYSMELKESLWCKPPVSFHHLFPHDIEVLWEYERIKRLQGKQILFADMYRDFVMPYIDHQIEDWDNESWTTIVTLAKDRQNNILPSTEGGDEVRPYESLDACLKFCEGLPDCLMYSYHKKKQQCAVAPLVKLGKPAHDFQKSAIKDSNQGMVSGWMIERIQQMRNRTECDVAYKSSDAVYKTGIDRTEGWLRREDRTIITGKPYLDRDTDYASDTDAGIA